jgi:hypothetical protein
MAVATGDFNRDGKMDVATANNWSDGISLLLGVGNGTFRPSINVPIGHAPSEILAADLNGDGRLDLVTANQDDDTASVLLGTGTGSFKPAVTYTVGDGPVAVAAGDVNGDTHIDVAVVNTGTGTVSLLLGTGTGKFTAGGTVTVNSNPTSIAVADFNNDDHPDIATVGGAFEHLDINLNNGDGTFAPRVNYATGFVAHSVVVGYFNNDQQPDLAVACTFPSNDGISVLLGNPDGTFQDFASYDTGGQSPDKLVVADLNGDGLQDLVTANEQVNANSVTVLLGVGDGTFGVPRVFTPGQRPIDVAVGDFNSDGVTDVVTADRQKPVGPGFWIGTVTLLLGNGDGTLAAAPNLIVGRPGPVTHADFNGDTLPDLAVVTSPVGYNGVTIFLGLGNGSFGPGLQSPEVDNPRALAVGDFNGDGKKDLAVTTWASSATGVRILLGNGDGTFTSTTTFAAGPTAEWVAVAHFNNDLHADLVVANDHATGSVSVLLGNGDGTFGAATGVSAGGQSNYVAPADLNGDGKADLAVVNNAANKVSIVLGNGNGTFGPVTSYATRVGPGSVGVGLFNGDSRPDLAVPTFFGGNGDSGLAILQNSTGGTFAPRAEYATDSRPVGISVTDFNGDGKLDLAVVNNFADDVYIFPGTGLGTFGAPTSYVVGDDAHWPTAADFNGDGRPDLAVSGTNSGLVTLLETPTTATHFRVNVIPVTATAGTAFQVVVAALDSGGHLVTNYTGSVSFTSTDPSATLPATYKFTTADHGVHRFNVTFRTAGSRDIVAHLGGNTGSDSVTVVATTANHLQVAASSGPIAGSPFDVTVTARDRFGNVATGYRGTVRLSTNDKGTGVALPADYTFTAADNGVHTFAGGATLVTAGLRTVSAKALATLWPLATSPVTIQAAAASQLTITGATSATAGVAFPVTVTARDQFGNVATGFTGTVQFASSDGSAVLPADYTFTPSDLGAHTFQPVLATAGPQSLSVSATGVTSGQQGGILVKPGAAAQLAFVQQPTNTFAATAQKPAVTVQVRDAFDNPVAAGVPVMLALSSNPGAALLGGRSALTATGGLATFKALTVSKGGEGYALVAKAGTGTSTPSSPFTIYKATHFGLSVSETQFAAGTAIAVTVTALDALNQPDPSYAGTVHFSSTASPLADLPPDYTFVPADNGQHTFAVTLKRSGLQTVTVADVLKPTVKKVANVTVSAGAVTGFLVSGYPLTTVHNVAHTFTVTAQDAFGNTVTGYQGTVQFSSAGGTAILPGPYTFKAIDRGRHVFTATFQTAGAGQSLTATDQANPSITGTEDGITVL